MMLLVSYARNGPLIRDPERLAIDDDFIALGDRTSGSKAPLDSSACRSED